MTDRTEYTAAAVKTITEAVNSEPDFAGWLAEVLARVAARKGSSGALTAGRPGSWEASLVDQLVKGTVGYDDEILGAYSEDAEAVRRNIAEAEQAMADGTPMVTLDDLPGENPPGVTPGPATTIG